MPSVILPESESDRLVAKQVRQLQAQERYQQLLNQLQSLPECDRDGPLAYALCAEMDGYWKAMGPAERDRFRGPGGERLAA